jgi:hypothetical protein
VVIAGRSSVFFRPGCIATETQRGQSRLVGKLRDAKGQIATRLHVIAYGKDVADDKSALDDPFLSFLLSCPKNKKGIEMDHRQQNVTEYLWTAPRVGESRRRTNLRRRVTSA